jgi:spermidine synthase
VTTALLFSVFVIATCGLVYELVAATLASYLLGDSVTQFSTVIGTYLFSMGIGSYLSRFIGSGLLTRFIQIELMVGMVGGLSAATLFLAFAYSTAFRLVLYLVVVAVGTLVGLEIPLLLRILKERLQFHDLVAQVLTWDYIGALAASLAFPLILVPKLGLVRAALFFGILNALVALWATRLFAAQLPHARALTVQSAFVIAALAGAFALSDRITTLSEQNVYADEIVLARTSPYQRIVLTRWRDDLRLFLNGHLQFSSRDEHRYHEALVHPAASAVPVLRRAVVLGGGDGLALRELLKYPSLEHVRLVDLDPEMTKLFAANALLTGINANSLKNPKVQIENQDALVWLDRGTETFDLALVDLPDPSNFSLGKLYTTTFYRLLARRLSQQGIVVVQATSPLFARRSFWCVVETMRASGFVTHPYHVYVPAFGEWGFVLATLAPGPGAGAGPAQPRFRVPSKFPEGLRFLTPEVAAAMFLFPPDMGPTPVEVNRLDNQALVGFYDQEWRNIVK